MIVRVIKLPKLKVEEGKMKKMSELYKPRYLPGLDGLRAIAVIGIIVFHLNAQWFSGGFLGVDTFFVISGYLITSLLMSEFYLHGTINLTQFWGRRFKRLIPAMLFIVSTVLIYTVTFEPKLILDIKRDAIAALFYVSNWWYIFQGVDYFNQFSIAPLRHLWSLAIEEQFYIIYPFVLLLLLKFLKYKKTLIVLFVISLISLGLMIYFNTPGSSHSRVYFGTDTRLQTLLLGCLLAFIWPPFRLKAKIPLGLSRIIDVIGSVSLITLLWMFMTLSSNSEWIYQGGFYLISLMTLLIIASAVVPYGLFSQLMGNKLFVYIGKRSYSLYLWHYPIISFVHMHFVDGQIPFYAYILDVVLMILATEFSYQFIETPIRKKGICAFTFNPLKIKRFSRLAMSVVLMVPLIFIFKGDFDSLGREQSQEKAHSYTTPKGEKEQPVHSQKRTDLAPLLIGDSVMVDIGQHFKSKMPNATIDGKVGRQLKDALPLIQTEYKDYTKSNDDVVIELGTNGDYSYQQMENIIQHFGNANIYLINTRVPRDYEMHVNQVIGDVAKRHNNVYIIDWYKASQGHTEYFAYDGIHLEKKGIEALSNIIVKKITEQRQNKSQQNDFRQNSHNLT